MRTASKPSRNLPSLDELRGKIVGLLVAPATKMAGVLAAPAGQLARVIGAYSKKEAA
jgi:large subunit ribosomal protein L10